MSAMAERAPMPETSLRAARREDYGFALHLYLESTRPLLVALGRWDEERILGRFAEGWHLEEAQIICRAGSPIGFLQVSKSGGTLHIDQIHIVAPWRSRGIGSRLILGLMAQARSAGMIVGLNVIRGNIRAIALYRRLGFEISGEDGEKIQMRWIPEGAAAR
jgi:ribosomal protein S18 acetylase RimI-like enzyme